MFLELKSAVSPSHALPGDLLPRAATVVAFFVPLIQETAKGNEKGRHCSRAWSVAYVETNTLIEGMSLHMQAYLDARHHETAVTPATHNFDPDVLLSDWSHRHAAVIAGLGKLGLNHMLITENGCCGRLGSFVTSLSVVPDSRPGREACLYRHNGTCRACVKKCVHQALKKERFDRFRCYEMCLSNDRLFLDVRTADVCGKCLVGVPCALTDPVRALPAGRPDRSGSKKS
jgi:epoxyqueuosine reductase QueG